MSDKINVRGVDVVAITSTSSLLDVFRAQHARSGRAGSASTWTAYSRDLDAFARWMHCDDVSDALRVLHDQGPLQGNTSVQSWINELATTLAPATVARKASALRSAWKLGKALGVFSWELLLRVPAPTSLRDVSGPSEDELRAMIRVALAQAGIKGLRDGAIVETLYTTAARRSELAERIVSDFEPDRRRLRIRGKGRDDFEYISIPQSTCDRIAAYLVARDAKPGEALFANCDRRSRGRSEPLTAGGLARVVAKIARDAGIDRKVSPHRIRHSAITAALDATDGDVRRVRLFSRHARVDTVLRYDDRRINVAGEIASKLAHEIAIPVAIDAGNEPADTATEAPENGPENERFRAQSLDLSPAARLPLPDRSGGEHGHE